MKQLKPAAERVRQAARELGLDVDVIEMPSSTRTAEDAANACDCDVAQIVKSLVFQNRETGAPVMFLVSGANRVNEERVGAALGYRLRRPDGDVVRDITGFAIGGIPPFGHARQIETFMDEDLLQEIVVWAAAGTPNSVFSISPLDLRTAINAAAIPMS